MEIVTDSPTDTLARHQHGLVTREQLRHLGWSRHAIERSVTHGCLAPLHRGIYRLAGSPDSLHQRMLAAVLRGGDGARLSGPALLACLGQRRVGSTTPPFILLPSGRRLTAAPFVWSLDRAPQHHHLDVGAIPSTTPARALVEAASGWRQRRVLAIHDDLRWGDQVAEGELARVAAQLGPRHPGARLIRQLVLDGELEQDSHGERSLADVLREIGLGQPARWQVWLSPTIRADCVLPGTPTWHAVAGAASGSTPPDLPRLVVLEYDGRGTGHDTHRERRDDAARQASIESQGIPVLRVRAADVDDPDRLRRRLRDLLLGWQVPA